MTPPNPSVTDKIANVEKGPPAPSLPLRPIKHRRDFLRAARAERVVTPGFIVQARQRLPEEADAEIRVGFTCSKRVGNAVARNRAKRRLRELARLVLPQEGRSGWDYVLIGRAGITAERPMPMMISDLRKALERLHTKS